MSEIEYFFFQDQAEFNRLYSDSLIYDFDSYELKGMEMKHKRNRRLLKKIRPEIVLSILYQEKNFNRELFKKRRNDSKNKKDQN